MVNERTKITFCPAQTTYLRLGVGIKRVIVCLLIFLDVRGALCSSQELLLFLWASRGYPHSSLRRVWAMSIVLLTAMQYPVSLHSCATSLFGRIIREQQAGMPKQLAIPTCFIDTGRYICQDPVVLEVLLVLAHCLCCLQQATIPTVEGFL